MNESLYMQMNLCLNLMLRLRDSENASIPQGQGKVLRILYKHGGLSQKDLADCLQIRPASLSELISKLELKGSIVKTPDSEDKRVFRISLSDSGRREAIELNKVAEAAFGGIFSSLNQQEKKTLSDLLTKVITSFDAGGNGCGMHDFCESCGLCVQGFIKHKAGD